MVTYTGTDFEGNVDPTVIVPAGGSADIRGAYGTLTISSNGDYTYTPDQDATDSLNEGDVVPDVFSYTIDDGGGLVYNDIILSQNPVAFYHLDEAVGTGTATDVSGNGNDATIATNVTTGQAGGERANLLD